MANPWQWRRGSSPYRHNAFTFLRATPADTTLAQLNNKARAMRRRVQYKPEEAKVYGREVTEVDVTQALQVLTSPAQRMVAEMFCHRPHQTDGRRFQSHLDFFSRLPVEGFDISDLKLRDNLDKLMFLVPQPLKREFPLSPPPPPETGDEFWLAGTGIRI